MVSSAFRRQTISMGAVLLSHFLHGCKVGWTSGVTSLLLSENPPFEITLQQISWIMSLPSLGDASSMLLSIVLGKKFPRKPSITIGLYLAIVTWILLSIAASPIFLMLSAFLVGFTSGLVQIIGGIYISEISSPQNRGTFITLSSIIDMLGTELEYLILLSGNYRLLAILPLIISIVAVITTIFMKESPYYLASIDLREKARRNMCWLNGKDKEEENNEHFENLTQYIKEENVGSNSILKQILMPENYKVLLMIIIIRVTSLINTNLIILRSGDGIIRDFKDLNGKFFVNIFGTSRVCFTVLALYTVKKFGRRSLILSGYSFMSIIHLLCGVFFCFNENHISVLYNHFIIATSLMLIQITSYLTIIPAVATLKTEVLPHNLKEFSMGVLKLFISIAVFLVVKFFFPLAASFGTSFDLFVFTIINAMGGLYAYFYVKETKNKTLLEIRREYKSDKKIGTSLDTKT